MKQSIANLIASVSATAEAPARLVQSECAHWISAFGFANAR